MLIAKGIAGQILRIATAVMLIAVFVIMAIGGIGALGPACSLCR
jgi:hypothetical protein